MFGFTLCFALKYKTDDKHCTHEPTKMIIDHYMFTTEHKKDSPVVRFQENIV